MCGAMRPMKPEQAGKADRRAGEGGADRQQDYAHPAGVQAEAARRFPAEREHVELVREGEGGDQRRARSRAAGAARRQSVRLASEPMRKSRVGVQGVGRRRSRRRPPPADEDVGYGHAREDEGYLGRAGALGYEQHQQRGGHRAGEGRNRHERLHGVGRRRSRRRRRAPAPEFTPMVLGAARGFASTLCVSAPLTARAAPGQDAAHHPGQAGVEHYPRTRRSRRCRRRGRRARPRARRLTGPRARLSTAASSGRTAPARRRAARADYG